MVLQGPPPSIGGSQPVSSSILRSSSGILGAESNSVPSQSTYSSLVSPRTHHNSMMLGNGAHMSSIRGQAYGNGGSSSLLTGPGSSQRGGIDSGAELDPLSSVGNGVNFSGPSSSFMPSNLASPSTSGHYQGQQFPNSSSSQFMPDQSPSQQLEQQKYQHDQQSMQQFSSQQNMQQQQQVQQQFQSVRGGLAGGGPVKLEPQTTNEQHGQQLQQPFQSMRNLAPVKLEPQQIPNIRNLAAVKLEPQHQDQSLFLSQQQQQLQLRQQQPQQQQQQLLPIARQSPQAAAAHMHLLNQQRLLQLHQHQQQQQQIFKNSIPSQRAQLPQQFQQQNLPLRSPVKSSHEPGKGARFLTRYMYYQQHRPQDNNIEFWRKFVTEYFAPNAKKKWCVSMYGSGRQTTGVFPQDAWHCEICNHKPGRGFEATVEVLPRLFKIKYESGTLEELLYVDMPREYQNSSGQIVLDYAKAIQESVFEQLRVVRDGQLRIVFSLDLKICSWEFCARRHEELIPRRLLMPQVSALGTAAQKYQSAAQNASSNLSLGELQSNCNMFVSSARQLAKALEVPLVNELGYTKRYVRCLQISEVVNCMKDLIDYSRETGTGPMESLAKFPRRTGTSSGIRSQVQSSEEQQQQQQTAENASTDQGSAQSAAMQLAAGSNMGTVNNTLNVASISASSSTIVGLLHQNSFNARQQNSTSNAGSPYGNNGVHISSPSSSSTVPPGQSNPSTFQSPAHPSSSNPSNSHGALPVSSHMNSISSPLNVPLQQSTLINENDPNDSRSSVQKILQEIVMSGHGPGSGAMFGVGSLGNDVKHVNGSLPSNTNNGLSGANSLSGNGAINNCSIGGAGYGTLGPQLGPSVTINGFRTATGNNSIMNGRGTIPSLRDQSMNPQDLNNQHQLLNGLGSTNGFGSTQYDWKPSP